MTRIAVHPSGPHESTGDGMATNRYTEQLADSPRRLAELNSDEEARRVRAQSHDAAFPSLIGHQAASAQAVEQFVAAAARRLMRWHDPRTGGLDVNDRIALLRQSQVMGFAPAVAERLLEGAEAAFRNHPHRPHRPHHTHAAGSLAKKPLRRKSPVRSLWFTRLRPPGWLRNAIAWVLALAVLLAGIAASLWGWLQLL